jgi:hypothetical protein
LILSCRRSGTILTAIRTGGILWTTLFLALLLVGCASVKPGGPNLESGQSPISLRDTLSQGIHFQLIYVVHGDASYTYHDSTGRPHAADSEAVAQAQDVGRGSPASEVFVFYQMRRPWKLFGVSPDGLLFQYRHGVLLRTESYSRAEDSDFNIEADLFHKYALSSNLSARFFTYFGHEIPAAEGGAYSQSYPDRDFSLTEFTQGIQHFARSDSGTVIPFNLLVLSVCYGGTPIIVNALTPYTDYLLASPAYLHLSFLDTHAFENLPDTLQVYDTAQTHLLAQNMALQSFDRLKQNTQTEITVGLYNVQKTEFPRIFAASKNWKTLSPDYHDCAEDTEFGLMDSLSTKRGVELYYQAPRFGALRNKLRHSGWECPGNAP